MRPFVCTLAAAVQSCRASPFRLLDHPDRQQADSLPRAEAGRVAPDVQAAQSVEPGHRHALVRARTALGQSRAGSVGADERAQEARTSWTRLAARRSEQGPSRAFLEIRTALGKGSWTAGEGRGRPDRILRRRPPQAEGATHRPPASRGRQGQATLDNRR